MGSRVFLTGDCHATFDFHKLATKRWPEQKNLTKDDVLIVTGDFGVVWDDSKEDKYLQDWYENKNFTTLACLGNHENYNLIEKLPIVDFAGGKVYQIRPSVYFAINGEIYTINNEKYFFMGGAPSHDKVFRKEGQSWWPQEIPSLEQREKAIESLEKVNYKVDYIITHCGPREVVRDKLGFEPHEYNGFLSFILHTIEFKEWYMGHYHLNRNFPLEPILKNIHILYNQIIELK